MTEKQGPTKAEDTMAVLLDAKRAAPEDILDARAALWRGDSEFFLSRLPEEPLFDLVVTSPPYNIGKSYETKEDIRSGS